MFLSNAYAQESAPSVTLMNAKRQLKFVTEWEGSNDEFWKPNHSMLSVLIQGVMDEKLTAYLQRYPNPSRYPYKLQGERLDKKFDVKPDYDRFWCENRRYRNGSIAYYEGDKYRSKESHNRGTIPAEETSKWELVHAGPERYKATDFNYFSLDETFGSIKGKEITQYHYINIYHPWKKKIMEKPDYLFSIKWSDAIAFLKEQNSIYYRGSNDSWYAANVITNSSTAKSKKLGTDLFRLALSNNLKIENQKGVALDTMLHLNSSRRFEMPLGSFHIKENRKGDFYEIETLIFKQWLPKFRKDKGELANVYTIDWKLLMKKTKKNDYSPEMYKMVDAVRMNLFSFSTNYKFSTQQLETESKVKIVPNSTITPAEVNLKDRFGTIMREELDLTIKKNQPLISGKTSFVQLIIDNVKNGQLTLHPKINGKIISENMVSMASFNHSITVTSEESKSETSTPSSNSTDGKLIPTTEFTQLGLIQNIHFDALGNQKSYEVYGVELYLPMLTKYNSNGWHEFVCFVKWDELKPLLKNKKVVVNGKEILLAELIEQRQFHSTFDWTGVISN